MDAPLPPPRLRAGHVRKFYHEQHHAVDHNLAELAQGKKGKIGARFFGVVLAVLEVPLDILKSSVSLLEASALAVGNLVCMVAINPVYKAATGKKKFAHASEDFQDAATHAIRDLGKTIFKTALFPAFMARHVVHMTRHPKEYATALEREHWFLQGLCQNEIDGEEKSPPDWLKRLQALNDRLKGNESGTPSKFYINPDAVENDHGTAEKLRAAVKRWWLAQSGREKVASAPTPSTEQKAVHSKNAKRVVPTPSGEPQAQAQTGKSQNALGDETRDLHEKGSSIEAPLPSTAEVANQLLDLFAPLTSIEKTGIVQSIAEGKDYGRLPLQSYPSKTGELEVQTYFAVNKETKQIHVLRAIREEGDHLWQATAHRTITQRETSFLEEHLPFEPYNRDWCVDFKENRWPGREYHLLQDLCLPEEMPGGFFAPPPRLSEEEVKALLARDVPVDKGGPELSEDEKHWIAGQITQWVTRPRFQRSTLDASKSVYVLQRMAQESESERFDHRQFLVEVMRLNKGRWHLLILAFDKPPERYCEVSDIDKATIVKSGYLDSEEGDRFYARCNVGDEYLGWQKLGEI